MPPDSNTSTDFQQRAPRSWFVFLLVIFSGVVVFFWVTKSFDETPKTKGMFDADVHITPLFSSLVTGRDAATVDEISAGQLDAQSVSPPEKFMMGEANKTYWYKGTFTPSELQGFAYLEIPHAVIDYVDVWFFSGTSEWHYQDGAFRPFEQKLIKTPGVVLPLPDSNNALKDDLTIIVKINSVSPMTFSVWLWEAQHWHDHQLHTSLWHGIVFGGIAILSLYNLFLCLSFRDIRYMYYIVYMLGFSLFNAGLSGVSAQYLWPTEPIASKSLLMVVAVTNLFGLLFINAMLDVRHHYPTWWRVSLIIMALPVPLALPELFGYFNLGAWNAILAGTVMFIANLGVFYYLFIVSALYFFKEVKQARFFIVSFVVFTLNYLSFYSYILGFSPPSEFQAHQLELGLLLEGLLLSFALADRVNLLSLEKKQIEQTALRAQQSFSKKLINMQEAESEKFSTVIHDTIGHGLLVLKQNLDKLSNEHNISKEDLRLQSQYCRELTREVRRVSHDLHPHILNRLGLKAAIDATVMTAFQHTEIDWHVEVVGLIEDLAEEKRTLIYRIVQESVNNILKHANASEVLIMLNVDKLGSVLTVKDDGNGFDTSQQPFGLGLGTLSGRLALFDGKLTIHTAPDEGCQLQIVIPHQPKTLHIDHDQ